jgi:hypothetical protein
MLIGTLLLSGGEEYPGKVCDVGFQTPSVASRRHSQAASGFKPRSDRYWRIASEAGALHK